MVTILPSTSSCFVRKSAPIVALYTLLNFDVTNLFINEVLPTLQGAAMSERASERSPSSARTKLRKVREWRLVRLKHALSMYEKTGHSKRDHHHGDDDNEQQQRRREPI